MRSVARLGRSVIRQVRHSGSTTQYTAPTLRDLTNAQAAKVQETNERLRTRHVQIEATMDADEKDFARRKRMIYRSKQRGWLEADILMGSWAVENVPKLTTAQLDEYETILNEETIDIFNYITGKDPLPERLQGLGLMKDLQAYALRSQVFDPKKYEEIKKSSNLT